jgi:predicted metal-dependent hydrolase
MIAVARDELVVDDLAFDVRRSDRRTTMQITVDRGGELILSVPTACPTTTMERFVRQKRFWVYTRLAEKEALHRTTAKKSFVTGEGFPYLGKHYRLQLVSAQDVPVKLSAGRLKMDREAAAQGARHLRAWYSERATAWLSRRVELLAPRVGRQPASVVVQDLGFRWGSCSKNERINFHWKTILLPPRIVDYVVIHELAHLFEAHHTPHFWKRVERAMPDFAARKRWLLENAAELVEL